MQRRDEKPLHAYSLEAYTLETVRAAGEVSCHTGSVMSFPCGRLL
jgi:hypothetical protein